MRDRGDIITANLLKKWEISGPRQNHPNVPGFSKILHHLRLFAKDVAYVNAPQNPNAPEAFETTYIQHPSGLGTKGQHNNVC